MRTKLFALLAAWMVVGATSLARADTLDLDLAGLALIGTGVDTGNNPDNPYALQVGGAVELIVNGYIVGVRASRALNFDEERSALDYRSFGGDLGFEWTLLNELLHIGPRLGLGRLSTVNEDFDWFYLEPGAVAEVEIGMFDAGAEVRYRAVIDESDNNGLLVYARLGLRLDLI